MLKLGAGRTGGVEQNARLIELCLQKPRAFGTLPTVISLLNTIRDTDTATKSWPSLISRTLHRMQVGSEGLLGDGERTDDLAPS